MSSFRTFVLGDVHGAYRALRQCLERSGFNKAKDHLIFLGDVCDGWPETKSCIDEFMTIPSITFLLGNHDIWAMEWMRSGLAEDLWLEQGGLATVKSYEPEIPPAHISFFEKALPYYVLDNKLFVHAGINTQLPIEVQTIRTLSWDRNLARTALDLYNRGIHGKLTDYDEIYIGHTPVPFGQPIRSSEIWMMDTGAGWSGVLSMMDIETKEIFTSDPVPSLYPGIPGRRKS